MEFAHCPRLGRGLCQSEEERQTEINELVDKVSWIRSGSSITTPARHYDAATLIVFQSPHPGPLGPSTARPENVARNWRMVWRKAFRKWKKKPTEEVFENSLNSFGQTYAWIICKTLRKSHLRHLEVMENLKNAQREGFHVQIIVKNKELRYPTSDADTPRTVRISLDEFCKTYSPLFDSAPVPLR